MADENSEINNIKYTIEQVLQYCSRDTTVLICGSFYFMGDSKRAIHGLRFNFNDETNMADNTTVSKK